MRSRAAAVWVIAAVGCADLTGLAGGPGAAPPDAAADSAPPEDAAAPEAAPIDGDAAETTPPRDANVEASDSPKQVFVSSAVFPANLRGLPGADSLCAMAAAKAGLRGDFKAWLSDDAVNAIDRISHGSGPYVLVDGLVVAMSWMQLAGAPLLHAISTDENGQSLAGMPYVWTGTTRGTAANGNTCTSWQSSTAGNGVVGLATAADMTWSNVALEQCSTEWHLYCFEQ